MKTPLKLAGLLLLSSFNLHPSTLLAQGSLTPPGAPAPTMKTLTQVEPRTPIASAPYTISVPGSYYLTANLTVNSGDAINITTNGVTLDLNGFTISSTANPAAGYGVRLNGALRDITIGNGHVRGGVTNNGSGVYSGIGFGTGVGNVSDLVNVMVFKVSVSGCLNYGILLYSGHSTVVESCAVQTIGGTGIAAGIIKGSVAFDCGSNALNGTQVSDSYGISNGAGAGVYATTAQNCHGRSSSGYGIYALASVQNSYGWSTSGTGIYASASAMNCYGSGGNGAGLVADVAQNCYGTSSYGTGLDASDVAIGCKGYSSTGVGLAAYIANSCRVAYGTASITYKYNMP